MQAHRLEYHQRRRPRVTELRELGLAEEPAKVSEMAWAQEPGWVLGPGTEPALVLSALVLGWVLGLPPA